MENMQNVYQENGYEDRKAYLLVLCAFYQRKMVMAAASLLGPSEDFDGLITTLEDAEDSGEFEEMED